MDKFRKAFESVRSRLTDLKPVHKVLVGSGLVILLMGMFIVTQYAGRADLVPISVDLADHEAVRARLTAAGIRFVPAGTDLLVPANQQVEAISAVSQTGNGSAGASALLKLIQGQPWYANRHQNRQQYYAALSEVLTDVISGWSYVKSASVFISAPEERAGGLARPAGKPTAAVAVVPADASFTAAQVEGIARFLSGTVPGLEPGNVTVHNASTGQPMRTRNEEDLAASAYMELQARVDGYWRTKIEDNLRHIPAVIVQVNAQVDASRERISDLTYKKEGEGSISPLVSETESKTNTSEASVGGNAGIQPNTGAGLSASSGPSNSTSMTESTSTFDPQTGRRETLREDPKGYARKINATVKIPRSFFERVWRMRNPDATDAPDAAALAALETEEIAKITQEVKALIDTEATSAVDGSSAFVGTVVVNTYTDLDPPPDPSREAQAGSGFFGLPSEFVQLPWSSLGLALLAGASLFFMFRLVRSSSSSRDLPSAAELVGIPPSLSTSIDDLIGEADESDPAIDAVELDDEELRTRTIMQQLGELVSRDPSDATRVVNRWISSEE